MLWYSQAGTPEVTACGSYDGASRTYRLDLTQTVPATPGQPTKDPMVIPLAIGLVGRNGRDLPLKLADGRSIERGVFALSQPADTLVFTDVDKAPILSLNRDFSAPIKPVANIEADELRFLAAHDSDPFNRWQAVQMLAMRLLIDNVAALRAGREQRSDAGLLDAFAAMLADPALEPAFVALTLTPPGETDIAREIGRDVDPDAIFSARLALRISTGEQLEGELNARYRALASSGPYRPDAEGAGRRSLRNVCLDFLVAARRPGATALAMQQYQRADNMTDRIAALTTLSLRANAERDTAVADFYERYAQDPLIVDKWLALQAAIPEPATLDRVKALTAHPAFSFANPNRVRALIGSFSMANQTQFNRADGAGYDFLVEHVLALDPKNPQVAARLLQALKSWRVLEPRRRAFAQAALRRVVAAPALSRDVSDIATRALGEVP
jgi:aminopeptidase N